MITVYVGTTLCKLNFGLPSSVLFYLNFKDGQNTTFQIKNQPFVLSLSYNNKKISKVKLLKFYKLLTPLHLHHEQLTSIYFALKCQDLITTVFQDNLARQTFKIKLRSFRSIQKCLTLLKLPALPCDYIYCHLK